MSERQKRKQKWLPGRGLVSYSTYLTEIKKQKLENQPEENSNQSTGSAPVFHLTTQQISTVESPKDQPSFSSYFPREFERADDGLPLKFLEKLSNWTVRKPAKLRTQRLMAGILHEHVTSFGNWSGQIRTSERKNCTMEAFGKTEIFKVLIAHITTFFGNQRNTAVHCIQSWLKTTNETRLRYHQQASAKKAILKKRTAVADARVTIPVIGNALATTAEVSLLESSQHSFTYSTPTRKSPRLSQNIPTATPRRSPRTSVTHRVLQMNEY